MLERDADQLSPMGKGHCGTGYDGWLTLRLLAFREELVRGLGLFAPHDDIPGKPAKAGDAGEGAVEGAERHPPAQGGWSFVEDALPIAIGVRMDAILQVILGEKQKRGEPEFAMADIGKIFSRQFQIGDGAAGTHPECGRPWPCGGRR